MSEKGFEDLGYAKIDTDRSRRTGFAEVIFCQGKNDRYIGEIFKRIYDAQGEVLGTRANSHQFEIVRDFISDITYDEVSGILKYESDNKEHIGNIAVCTAGTADIRVAEEAAKVAEFFGGNVKRYYDVGVAGIHRLLAVKDEIAEANCVIAVAGMEGALASVVGGLVSSPVIGVPTSVGYGVATGGTTALHSMLSSCANGISVVNIDNGYGAAYIASQINRMACGVK